MITPIQFDTYPDTLVNISQAFEEEIITRICYELSIDSRIASELIGQGLTQQEITELLAGFSGATVQEMERVYDRVYNQVVADENYLYDYFNSDSILSNDITKQTIIRATIHQTQNTFNNIARTSGFMINGVFTPMASVYQSVIDSTLQAIQGGRDARLAVRDTIMQLTNQGVVTVDYDANGRTIHTPIDVAVRRNVVTAMHQISNKVVEIQLEELGVEYYQVSAHKDARDRGTGPMNHKSWQGKIYSNNGDTSEYPDFVTVTGYGTGEGLGGWNCRHSFSLFMPGVTEPIDYNITDEPDFEYDGKIYTAYEATQRQRQIERNIRQYKRRLIGFEAGNIPTDDPIYRRTSRLLAGWNQEYTDFSAAANLRKQTERARVIGFGRGEAARARAAARA